MSTVHVYKCLSCGRHLSKNNDWINGSVESDNFKHVLLSYLPTKNFEKISLMCFPPDNTRILLSLSIVDGINKIEIYPFCLKLKLCEDCDEYSEAFGNTRWMCKIIIKKNTRYLPFELLKQKMMKLYESVPCQEFTEDGNILSYTFLNKNAGFKIVNILQQTMCCRVQQECSRINSVEEDTIINQLNYVITPPDVFLNDVIVLSDNELLICVDCNKDMKFINPYTGKILTLCNQEFWTMDPKPLSTDESRKRFKIIDKYVNELSSGNYIIVDLLVIDLNTGDVHNTKSHLGSLLNNGDICYGHIFNNIVILTRKCSRVYSERNWHIKGVKDGDELYSFIEDNPKFRYWLRLHPNSKDMGDDIDIDNIIIRKSEFESIK